MSFGAFAPFPLRLGGGTLDGFNTAQHARVCADMLAGVFAAPFAVIVFTTGVADSAVAYLGQHGVGLDNAPAVTMNTTGDGSVEWDTSYEDAAYNAEPVKLYGAVGSCLTGATDRFVYCELEANNKIRVRSRDIATSRLINSLVTLVVF